MTDWQVVTLKIVSMFLVMLAGWLVRRVEWLKDETTNALGRLVIDITFPALVFHQMVTTIDAAVLRESQVLLIVGAVILLAAAAVGSLMRRLFVSGQGGGGTFIFLVMMPNWIFLPLPIVTVLFGDLGIRTILILNVSAQLILWTLGLWVLRGGIRGVHATRNLLLNPGLVATVLGILAAFVFPQARELAAMTKPDTLISSLGAAGLQALGMLGSLTVPLSLLVTGAQLGGSIRAEAYPLRPLAGVLIARLLVAPLVTAALIGLLDAGGLELSIAIRNVAYIVSLMPVAVSAGMFVERYGGDRALSARAITYSTLLSTITVPVLYFVITRWG